MSTLLGGLGGQVTLLALPLTAALLLKATPFQMGLLTALEALPFLLFSLPVGVWLDRVRKLPVYVAGEWTIAVAVASVPLAWAAGALTMAQLYAAAFVLGCVTTVAGSASQLVLMQVVPRERLVDAHARSVLAMATADVAGPGLAGVLIRLVGAPLALLVDAVMLLASALIVRRIDAAETPAERPRAAFAPELVEGLRFVHSHALLWPLAGIVAGWQFCLHATMAVQVLFASRELQLSEQAIGFAYVASGIGSVLGSLFSGHISRWIGPGPTLVVGLAMTATGWLLPALASGMMAVIAFVGMLLLGGFGAVLVLVNFIAVRQAVTPPELLGRMTATMRWLVLAPGAPGALVGGWLGGSAHLSAPLLMAAGIAAVLVVGAISVGPIRGLKALPAAPTLPG